MVDEQSGKPETLAELLASMTPEIYERLKEAVALGRWENGERLAEEQKSLCLQAVIAYDQAYQNPENRVGYVKPKPAPCVPVDVSVVNIPAQEKGES